ncbi:hypothetical protein PS862_05272 [Pseudomonas fluorescens]|uniref:Multidrug resistance protein MdtA-like barrel-sandwich hybrid domain-containing protein n=1 Tax=Pseudomonas fluorescens TaxID=294 RepID=A0A5E7PG08_PSEFL|nr:HlyD family efflux transporter periplasmic adaptor subunit [Pseudomonas fluorescens]VVM98228.1 hypothetical protein PS639_03142 [Pseudomonas fluorescens]VVP48706.1 hypothetical protein PS862_05272 [Pseudomonas fluorescens]
MKIRFNSNKEHNPTQEHGLNVLYAPGKRMAFRLRWYLILFLVASPLLWLVGKLLYGFLLIDAPAQLHLPIQDVRAREAGRIEQVLVTAGDHVQTDQLLTKVDNLEWRVRLLQLAAMPVAPRQLGDNDLATKERQLLRATTNRAEQRVQQLESLVRQGAATHGEVLAAQAERDGLQSNLLAFERREQLAHLSPQGFDLEVIQQNTEQQWLKTRLEALSVTAPQSGRIAEVLVSPGENVGPGTLLMRLEQLTDPLLWIYLEPLYINYAQTGQPLKVHMPDGEWLDAHVVQAVDSASRTPLVLRGPFAASEMGLQVAAKFDQPLPARWRIDQLPLNVRFPNDWLGMLGIDK